MWIVSTRTRYTVSVRLDLVEELTFSCIFHVNAFVQLGLVFELVTARGRCFVLLANAFYFIKKGVFAEAPVHLLIQHRFAFVNEGALHLVNVYMSCNCTRRRFKTLFLHLLVPIVTLLGLVATTLLPFLDGFIFSAFGEFSGVKVVAWRRDIDCPVLLKRLEQLSRAQVNWK